MSSGDTERPADEEPIGLTSKLRRPASTSYTPSEPLRPTARDGANSLAPAAAASSDDACERDLHPMMTQPKSTDGDRALVSAESEAAVRTAMVTTRMNCDVDTYSTVPCTIAA